VKPGLPGNLLFVPHRYDLREVGLAGDGHVCVAVGPLLRRAHGRPGPEIRLPFFEALEPIRNWLLHGYRTLDQVRESQGIT